MGGQPSDREFERVREERSSDEREQVLESVTCTLTRLSANEMNHRSTCFSLPRQSWSSFTNLERIEG